MREVVIASAVRTAIGNFLGALNPFSATELGGKVIEEAVKRSKIQNRLFVNDLAWNESPLIFLTI